MEKPRFSELYTTHNVGAEHLAVKAGVLVETIDRMLTDRRVFQGQAEKVLTAFSKLTGESCALSNVHVYLLPVNQSEVARIKQEIEDEYTAGRRALHDSAFGVAKHEFITKKMENLQKGMNQLIELVGEDETLFFFKDLEREPKEQGDP